jgi:hypothetical protein
MQPEGSLLHSQVPATCSYSEPNQSSSSPPSHILKFHFNITIPSMPRSSKWSLSLRFPHQNHVHTSPLPNTCYMPRPSHSSPFYHPMILGTEYRPFSSALCNFLQSSVTSSLLGPNILLSISCQSHFVQIRFTTNRVKSGTPTRGNSEL